MNQLKAETCPVLTTRVLLVRGRVRLCKCGCQCPSSVCDTWEALPTSCCCLGLDPGSVCPSLPESH